MLQDELINLDDLTELEDTTVFQLEQLPNKSYEKDYDVQVDITIEMNLNQLVIVREGYTIFDFLSDIGGMQGILISFAAIFLGVWNYHFMDNFLVTRLYRLGQIKLQRTSEEFGKQQLVLTNSSLRSICDYFCEKLPSCCQCCFQKSQQARGLQEGRILLQKETNVINMVRSLRFFDKAIE